MNPRWVDIMSSTTTTWSGTEWEDHIQLLLKNKFPHGEYVEVPARHGGDLGIDGFTRDGTAYQAYAPQGLPSTADLYEKQRDKITTDLAKLQNNSGAVAALLGTTILRHWLLVTPRNESRHLIDHCAEKAKQLRSHSLSFISADFQVGVIGEEHFAVERARLLGAQAYSIKVAPSSEPDSTVPVGLPKLLETLRSKAADHPRLTTSDAQNQFVELMTRWLIDGQNVLRQLEVEAPEVHQRIIEAKTAFESRLAVQCLLGELPAERLVSEAMSQFGDRVSDTYQLMAPPTRDHVVNEAIADWLARCPLRFLST